MAPYFMSELLTTKTSIKNRLSIEVTSYDTLLDDIIGATSTRVNKMTGRLFTSATHSDEVHDGSDALGSCRKTLIIKNAPITSLVAVEYDAGTNANPNWTAFDAEDYRAELSAGLIHFPYGMPRGVQNVRVTYVGGYAEGEYPEDVVEAVEQVVVRIFKRRDAEGRTNESFQESSVTWTESVFSTENIATLKNYRRGYNL